MSRPRRTLVQICTVHEIGNELISVKHAFTHRLIIARLSSFGARSHARTRAHTHSKNRSAPVDYINGLFVWLYAYAYQVSASSSSSLVCCQRTKRLSLTMFGLLKWVFRDRVFFVSFHRLPSNAPRSIKPERCTRALRLSVLSSVYNYVGIKQLCVDRGDRSYGWSGRIGWTSGLAVP